jgi:hypothetical protein
MKVDLLGILPGGWTSLFNHNAKISILQTNPKVLGRFYLVSMGLNKFCHQAWFDLSSRA